MIPLVSGRLSHLEESMQACYSGKTKLLMAVSGAAGFTLFILSNFGLTAGLGIYTAFMQLAVNAFVHTAWKRGYRETTGFKRIFAAVAATVPVVMGIITVYRVIIPTLHNLFAN